MKKLNIILFYFLALIITSCNLLDVEPTTSWTVNFMVYGEMRSDVFYNNAFNVNIDKVVNNKLDYGMSLASWRTFYETIKQANLVLKYTPGLVEEGIVPEANANSLMGQAY